jgi:ketosteroid isomerase-like protein
MNPDIKAVFESYQRGDVGPLAAALAPDVAWVVPGKSRLAGQYNGLDGILGLFDLAQTVSGGTYQQSLVDVLTGVSHAAVLYRATGRHATASLDIDMVLLCRLDGHLVTHITALPCDPGAFEAFWGLTDSLDDGM